MIKRRYLAMASLAVTVTVVAVGLAASGCEFFFSFDEITAPLATVGEIGVRVQKTHGRCTLSGMEDYQFGWEGIQILGETPWEEIDSNLYEKWFKISLSRIGSGYLKISKHCTKEGYEEAVVPITILEPASEGDWQQAYGGTYPFELPGGASVESAIGEASVTRDAIQVAGLTIELPVDPGGLEGEMGTARVFYARSTRDEITPLIIVSESYFLRFDHLWET
jgi:hypothetical protein